MENKQRDFWVIVYRHLYGILVAIKDYQLKDCDKTLETTKPEVTSMTPNIKHNS